MGIFRGVTENQQITTIRSCKLHRVRGEEIQPRESSDHRTLLSISVVAPERHLNISHLINLGFHSILALFAVCSFVSAHEKQHQGKLEQDAPPKSPETFEARLSPRTIPEIDLPIKLDGSIDEPAWEGIEPFYPVGYTPNSGKEPSEGTEILIGYDIEYLYVAGRLYDREPGEIQATSMKRDDMKLSSDWCGIILDTFNDNENALAFFTTPTGLRLDATVSDDARGRFPVNTSWNTFWDVETVIDSEGWFVEMRIPVSSLRFQEKGGRVVMGLIVWRFIARKNEVVTFPAIQPDWGWWGSFKPSQAQKIQFENLQSRKPLYTTPYLLAGTAWTYDLDSTESLYHRKDDPAREIGLDVKYGITNNLTLDLTLNTDFAQVEADEQQINLTRFSLFYPERRMFFQERASIFNFGGYGRLFYSRRIGIYEGNLTRIYGGARLVGRIGQWDVGFLNMQTAAIEELPSQNFGVLRLRRQVVNPYSYVGGIVTSRIGTDGTYNAVYGFDGMVRFLEDDYLTMHWSQSFESGKRNSVVSLDPSRFGITWERRTIRGFGYNLSYSRAGRDFEPGIGFQMRQEYSRLGVRTLHGWLPGEDSWLLRHSVFVRTSLFQRNSDGVIESAEIEPGWQFDSKSGLEVALGPKFYYENVPESFSLADDAEVPIGRYHFSELSLQFQTPQSESYTMEGQLDLGSFYDGRRISIRITPQWSVSSNFEFSGTYEFNKVTFAERNQEFTSHLARIRVLTMFSTQLSASAFVQVNTAAHTVTSNFRLRYNRREGNDFYLVYNERLNTNRHREQPTFPYLSDRTILLKYTYTLSY